MHTQSSPANVLPFPAGPSATPHLPKRLSPDDIVDRAERRRAERCFVNICIFVLAAVLGAGYLADRLHHLKLFLLAFLLPSGLIVLGLVALAVLDALAPGCRCGVDHSKQFPTPADIQAMVDAHRNH
jgi:hypothetical protein